MNLDETKIITAVNAEELVIGARYIFANSLAQLKENYNNHDYKILDRVNPEDFAFRFTSEGNDYALAYIAEYEPDDIMERFERLRLGTNLSIKEEYNEGYAFLVTVTGYDRNTMRFYAAGKWYEAKDLDMFDEDIV